MRNQIEVLTKNLNEAQKQMGYIIKAKYSMEDETGVDVCKIPRVLNSVCNALNTPKNSDNLEDNWNLY